MSDSSISPHRTTPVVAADAGAPAAVATVIGPDGMLIAAVSRRVRTGDSGPEVVVSVRGDLDLDTAPLARATLIQALDGAERVCLNLSETDFFGAAGVRVVLVARAHAASLGRTLRLGGVRGLTERVLTLTGLWPWD